MFNLKDPANPDLRARVLQVRLQMCQPLLRPAGTASLSAPVHMVDLIKTAYVACTTFVLPHFTCTAHAQPPYCPTVLALPMRHLRTASHRTCTAG